MLRLGLTLLTLGVPFGATHGRVTAARFSAPRYAVIIVLDGARPDYFSLARMPHLRWLQARGVTYTQAFVGQEIANTPPAHATIGTGLFPRRHGVEGFVWRDPRTNMMTRPADQPALLQGALEQVMEQHHVPSIAAVVKSSDPRARVVAVSGHKCYAADAMGTPAADYILCALIYHNRWVAQAVGNHRPPPGAINNPQWDVPIPRPSEGFAPAVEQWRLTTENDWTVRYALWAFHRVHYPRVLMINLPETDVTGHFAGENKRVPAALMQAFDRELGQIINAYDRAGILARTVFLVTADHGMTRVDTRLPFSVLDRSIAVAGATKVYLEADTAAVIGIRELNRARQVARNVAHFGGSAIDATYFKVLQHGAWSYQPAYIRPDLPYQLRRAYLTLAGTLASADGPEVMAIYAPHVTTGDRIVRQYHWLAGHLGPQWDEQHIPLVLAGPGVRMGLTSDFPARLVDIAPTVERLLDLPIGPVDGNVLADALTVPSGAEQRRQAALRAVLMPLVRAIQQRSGSQ